MSWIPAIEDRISKLRVATERIRRHFNPSSLLSQKLRIHIYIVCLRTVLMYGLHLWWCVSQTHLRKIHVAQGQVLRIIFDKPTWLSSTELHHRAQWQPSLEYIKNVLSRFNVKNHVNPLVKLTGMYSRIEAWYHIKLNHLFSWKWGVSEAAFSICTLGFLKIFGLIILMLITIIIFGR